MLELCDDRHGGSCAGKDQRGHKPAAFVATVACRLRVWLIPGLLRVAVLSVLVRFSAFFAEAAFLSSECPLSNTPPELPFVRLSLYPAVAGSREVTLATCAERSWSSSSNCLPIFFVSGRPASSLSGMLFEERASIEESMNTNFRARARSVSLEPLLLKLLSPLDSGCDMCVCFGCGER